jgi:hypothetical protein
MLRILADFGFPQQIFEIEGIFLLPHTPEINRLINEFVPSPIESSFLEVFKLPPRRDNSSIIYVRHFYQINIKA